MATAPTTRSLQRFAGRQLLLAVVVVLFAMVALALLAEALTGGDGGTVYLAQIQSADQPLTGPSLVAVGYGKAEAPAKVAEVQLLFTEFEGNFESVPSPLDPDATPGAEEREAAAPIVAALVATGLPEDAVRVVTSAAFGSRFFGPGPGTSIFRVDFTLADPDLETVNRLIDEAHQAATANGYGLVQAGAAYGAEDCGPLRARAWQAAADDARARATDQAAQLGVKLGDLIASHEVAVAGSADLLGAATTADPCSPAEPPVDFFDGGSVTITVPSFDPASAPVAAAYAQVSLAYEIVRD